jgi:hypothetical protein
LTARRGFAAVLIFACVIGGLFAFGPTDCSSARCLVVAYTLFDAWVKRPTPMRLRMRQRTHRAIRDAEQQP